MSSTFRWAWSEIDLDAIAHNVRVLRERVAPSALWAVVKADGYGHGASTSPARRSSAGAEGLCVALVEEGIELRRAGIDAPILILSEQPPESAARIIEYRLTPTVYRLAFLDALTAERPAGLPVHLKVDTGMQRVGVHPHAAASMADVHHPACACSPARRRLHSSRGGGRRSAGLGASSPTNSSRRSTRCSSSCLPCRSSTLPTRQPGSRVRMRVGRLFGLGSRCTGSRPVMGSTTCATTCVPRLELRARVSFVKQVRAGSRISYGLRHRFDRDTTVATIPIGYADGVPRRLSAVGGEVLIGGRRRPIVGRGHDGPADGRLRRRRRRPWAMT